jgi:hypothetical protein
METIGCHAVFNPKRYPIDEPKCELFGKYDLIRPKGLYYQGKGWQELAERKCFDPDHYSTHHATSPCKDNSWECEDRYVETREIWKFPALYQCLYQ